MDDFCPSPEVIARRYDECSILIHLGSNQIYELNATGSWIWALLCDGRSTSSILRQLEQHFEIEADTLADQVSRLLTELAAEGVVTRRLDPPAVVAALPIQRPKSARESASAEGDWLLRWSPVAGRPARVHGRGGVQPLTPTASGHAVWMTGHGREVGSDQRVTDDRLGQLFATHGSELGDRVRGECMLVVVEADGRRLWVWRDPMGSIPCFYHSSGSVFLLSSSLDVLLAQPEVASELWRPYLAEYLIDRSSPLQAAETFYREVQRLPAGHRLMVDGRGLRTQRFWQPLPRGFEWAAASEVEQIPRLLSRAVERCLAAGGDSLALSGGFDSVALAALAAAGGGPALAAFSIRFSGTSIDESAVQREVARRLGMRWTCRQLDGVLDDESFLDRSSELFGLLPAPPLGLWQALYADLARAAADQGCKGLLFGTGGDEMFIVDPGYAGDLLEQGRWRDLAAFVRAWQRSSSLPAAAVARHLLVSSALRPWLAVHLPAAARTLGSVRRAFAAGSSRPTVSGCLTEEMKQELVERGTEHEVAGDGDYRYRQALHALIEGPQVASELEQASILGAQYGVRPLYPFFDRDLVRLALRLPPGALYAGGLMKAPLRRLVRRRLPNLPVPARKVDFTTVGRQVLCRSGQRTWRRLGGARRLADLGIVSFERAASVMDSFFARPAGPWLGAWLLLSTEAWLQARAAAGK